MDRRQRKTRTAIMRAFINLLSKKAFDRITVSEIIENADIGRATFYSHFETKDFLLKEICEELFCHIFDAIDENHEHKHIFDCNTSDSAFLHLFRHLQNNDNRILDLLSGDNNEIFLNYFKAGMIQLVESHPTLFPTKKSDELPDSYWIHHITSTFVETIQWWICNGKEESPETMNLYFLMVL